MKKLILDYYKWRCGGDGEGKKGCSLGKGYTQLLNNEGFMCCLGQFSFQLNENIKEQDILEYGEPGEIDKKIIGLNYKKENNFFYIF